MISKAALDTVSHHPKKLRASVFALASWRMVGRKLCYGRRFVQVPAGRKSIYFARVTWEGFEMNITQNWVQTLIEFLWLVDGSFLYLMHSFIF